MKSRLAGILAAAGTLGLLASACASSSPVHYGSLRTFDQVGPTPHFAAVDPATDTLFVSNLPAATLSMVDAADGVPSGSVAVGKVPHTVMYSAGRIYVTDLGSSTLSIVDATTHQVIATVAVGTMPHGLAVDAEHHRIYVTNVKDDSVSVIDSTTDRVITTIALPAEGGRQAWPWGITVDPQRNRAWVTDTGQLPATGGTLTSSGADTVEEIDTTSERIVGSVVVGAGPWNAAVDEATGDVYVGVTSSNHVVVIHNLKVTARIPVGRNPHGIVIDQARGLAFVNNAGSNTVTVIDTTHDRITQTIPVGRQPQGIALDATRHLVYVVDQAQGAVTVLGSR
jgi:YVTN family beta-propeller protein